MSTAFNPAKRLQIDGKATFDGIALVNNGDIIEKPLFAYKPVKLGAGRVRNLKTVIGYQFTVPVVATLASLMPIYKKWAKVRYGHCVAPRPIEIASLDATANTFTSVAHGLTTSDSVNVHWDGTIPSTTPALDTSEVYTATATDADTLTLTTTSGTPTLVDITSATLNTGLWVAKQDQLVIAERNTRVRTFLNVVPVELPSLVFNGAELQWEGNFVFRCFPKLGATAAGGTAGFYTSSNAAFTSPTWAGTEDITASDMTAAWASGLTSNLETSFRCEKGMKVSFKPNLSDMDDGVFSGTSAVLTGFDVEATGMPIGLLDSEFATLLPPTQGAQVTGANLVLTATGITVTLYDAQVLEGEQRFSSENALTGDLVFKAMGNSTTDNKPPFLVA